MDHPDSLFIEKLISGLIPEEGQGISSLFEKVRKAPKTDLHFHLAGSIRPETLFDLATSDSEPIDWAVTNRILREENDIGEAIRRGGIQKAKQLLEYREEPGSLQRYIELYSIPQSVLAFPGAVRRIAYEAAESSYADGVRKLEVRFNPLRIDSSILPADLILAVSQGFEEAARVLPGLRTGLIISINKAFARSEVGAIVQMTVDMVRHAGLEGRIVAVDTSGPEIGFEPEKFAEPFRKAREKGGLGVVCHAGEDFVAIEDGLDAIEKAVRLLGAKRIGHGLAAGLNLETLLERADGNGNIYTRERLERVRERQDEVLNLLVDSDVVIEVCPSSNIHTGKVEDMREHPIKRFLQAGVPVAISTDNMRISHTKLTWEHLRIAKAFGYGFDTIFRIIDTGNAYSYL